MRDPSLVTAVRFDRLSPAGRAGDRSGQGRAAELGGTARIVPDHRLGSCLGLDGAGWASITLDGEGGPTDELTVALWVRVAARAPTMPLVSLVAGGEHLVADMRLEDGRLRVSVDGEVAASSGRRLAAQRWHHLAVTVDGSTGHCWCYVDGRPAEADDVPNGPLPVDRLLVGADAAGCDLDGRFGGLRLYRRVLDPDEVGAVMAADGGPVPDDGVGPVLDLDFRALAAGRAAPDAARPGRFAVAIGAPAVVVDGTVGHAVELDGADDHYEVDDPTMLDRAEAFTVAAWLRADTVAEVDGLVERPATDTGRHAPHWALHLERGHVRAYVDGENVGRATTAVEPRRWHHVAVTWDGTVREAYYFLDGVQVAIHGGGRTRSSQLLARIEHPVRIGYRGTPSHFGGRLRSVTIHDRALSPAEVSTVVARDRRTLMSEFDLASPLAFRLAADDARPTLAIVDDGVPGASVHVVLEARSPVPLVLAPLPGRVPGPDEHHLELRLRPRTLHPDALQAARVADDGWRAATHVHADGRQSIYLLAEERIVLRPGQRRVITLRRLHADPVHGDRPTRVMLSHRGLTFAGDDTPLAGRCTSTVQVVDQRGSAEPPFRIGLSGTTTVIAGQLNRLTLFVANASATETVAFAGPGADAPSRLVVEFEEQDDADGAQPWALASHSDVAGIELAPDADDLVVHSSTLGRKTVWTVGSFDGSLVLHPGQRRDLVFTDVPCNGAAGVTELRVRHENVPGFRDGSTSVALEKRPWTFLVPDAAGAERDLAEAAERTTAAESAHVRARAEQASLRASYDALVDQVAQLDARIESMIPRPDDWFAMSARAISDLVDTIDGPVVVGSIRTGGLQDEIALLTVLSRIDHTAKQELFEKHQELDTARAELATAREQVATARTDVARRDAIVGRRADTTAERDATWARARNADRAVDDTARRLESATLVESSARARLARIAGRQVIGVGTTEPSHTLDVAGDIRARGELFDGRGPVLPAGAIVMFTDDSNRAGWAVCDGRTVEGFDAPDLRPGGEGSFEHEAVVPFVKLPPTLSGPPHLAQDGDAEPAQPDEAPSGEEVGS